MLRYLTLHPEARESRIQALRQVALKHRIILPMNEVVTKYCQLGMSVLSLAKEYGCDGNTIKKNLIAIGIPIRGLSEACNISYTKECHKNAVLGKPRPSIQGVNNPFYGKKHTKEELIKIRDARAKQVFTEETFAKRAESLKRLYLNNPEAREKRISLAKSLSSNPKIVARRAASFRKALRDNPSLRERVGHTELWKNKEWANKTLSSVRMAANIRPNNIERTVLNILNECYPNEWRYVGDGSFQISLT